MKTENDDMEVFGWVCVKSDRDIIGKGRTGSFFLPTGVIDLINEGSELGDGADVVFNTANMKKKYGKGF